MKKSVLFLIVGGLVLIGVAITLILVFNKKKVSTTAASYVSVSLNPAVEFTVNKNDQVVSVLATDAEGDLIVQNFDFFGMDIVVACEKFVQLCIDAGYVNINADENSEDGNNVSITVVNSDDSIQLKLRNRIANKINNCFVNNGIFGKVSEETLTEYLDEAVQYGLSVGHIKLIMLALEFNPELTLNDLVDLPINEVVAIIKNKHNDIKKTTAENRLALKNAIQELKESEKYSDMFTAIAEIDSIQESLNNGELSAEERASLENQLAELKSAFDNTFSLLLDEFKTERKALFVQSKEASKNTINGFKEQFKSRVKNFASQRNEAQKRQNIKNRIKSWQIENE